MMARLMGLPTVSPAELQAMLREGRAHAFDVNAPMSWNEAHVPGATSLDHERIAATDLPSDKATTLVFYCSNPLCRKAPFAAKRARALGHTDVRVLSAGIRGWIAAGLPTESA